MGKKEWELAKSMITEADVDIMDVDIIQTTTENESIIIINEERPT